MDITNELDQIKYDPLEEEERLLNAQREEERRDQELRDAAVREEEERKAAAAAEKEKEDSKHFGDRVLDTPVVGQVASVGAGVIDTAFDAASLIPWLKPADEWWDEHHGRDREMNGVNKFIRDASGIIIPTLTGGGLVAKGAQGLAAAGKLGKTAQAASALRRTQVLGKIAVDLGVGTAVEAVSEQTDEAGNLGTALEDMLGVQVPWASRDSDSPDVIRAKNLLESFALGGAVGVADAFFSLRPRTTLIPKDEAAKQILDERNFTESVNLNQADGDELVAKVVANQNARDEALIEKGVQRFEEAAGAYDPYVNTPSFEMERPVLNYQPDVPMAKVAYARIADNIGTTYGAAPPVASEYYMKEILRADAPGRSVLLDEIVDKAKPEFDARIKTSKGTETVNAAEQRKALNELTEAVTKSDPTEFKNLVEKSLDFTEDRIVVGGEKIKLLTTAGAKQATEVLMRGLDIIAPEKLRASAMVTNQAATDQAILSTAVDVIGDSVNTASQQEMIIDNLALLIREVGVHKSIKGTGLNAVKFLEEAKRADTLDVDWWANEADHFTEAVAEHTRKATELASELKTVAKQNPEYLKPLYREMAKTGGKVDSIHALNKLVENRLGFWKKAFRDGSPEMPSNLVREIQTARYNSVLTGLAPVRAAAGAFTALVGKPLTVFAGSAGGRIFGGKEGADAWKRAMYTYGGVFENLQRGFKNLQTEWKYALDNPRASANHARKDLQVNALDDYETLEEMSSQWYQDGHFGKVAVWNMTKTLAFLNDKPLPRFGLNAMRAIDGFTKSFTASMASRAKAYDDLLSQSRGAFNEADFQKMQRDIYNDMFDADGLMKADSANVAQDAAAFAAGEINLNLDSEVVDSLENVMRNFPVMKSIFMFPRTGVNALDLAATFSPGNAVAAITNGKLNLALGKARRVFAAQSERQIKDVMSEHGLAGFGPEAFKQLQAEYTGRYMMGSAVTMGAALMAAQGLITGSGPQDDAEKRRMQGMGWKPFSFKDPVTGKWLSYQGLEPFDSFLGLTADIVFNFNRVDEAVTEDWFRALAHSVSMNISQKTFLSGFEPLAGLISGDPSALNRFMVNNTDQLIPGAGIRSLLNKAITPQLKDVENNYQGWLANRNKWLIGDGIEDYLDIYTGDPINYTDPWTRAWNTFAPFFKVNPGMEPWRQQLLASGWDNLQTVRRNRTDGQPLKPEERQFINNWIAQNYKLGERVEKLFNAGPKFWDKKMKEYVKERGLKTQDEYPIKETLLHQLLDELHNDAFRAGFDALSSTNADYAARKEMTSYRDSQLNQGNYAEASDTAAAIKKITDIPR
tara:strand:+ start:12018 stop:15968 length:3951 start_codon:yes stop_codon:yes gene_type:complete